MCVVCALFVCVCVCFCLFLSFFVYLFVRLVCLVGCVLLVFDSGVETVPAFCLFLRLGGGGGGRNGIVHRLQLRC